MRFLREWSGQIETAWASPKRTAAEKSKALNVLRDLVVLVAHPYERDPYSGAGNCWCGRNQGSKLHAVVVEP